MSSGVAFMDVDNVPGNDSNARPVNMKAQSTLQSFF